MGLVAKAFQDIITFSRASSGTYVNSNGYITNSSVLNYLTYSNQPENAAWTKSNSFVQQNLAINSQDFDLWSLGAGVTVAANSTIAPDGTLTADRITFTAGGSLEFVRRSATLTVGVIYTASVYAQIASGTPTFIFDAGNAIPSTAQTPTAAWQRFTFTFTFSGANQWVDLEASGAGTIAFWGAQLVQGSVPGDYRATTSAALPVLYADYNGALRARKLCETAGAATTHTVNQTVTTTVGQAVTFSWYLKKGERNFGLLYTNAGQGKSFNLNTGALGADFLAAPYSSAISSLGNGWYRCSITIFATAASTICYCYTADADASGFYTGDGSSGIYIADAQLNDGSSALAYYDTTASAYNAPRFDYDPVTLAAKGLLVEESRANLLLQSNDFATTWTPISVTITQNSTLSPDGTANADTIAASATGVGSRVQQDVVVSTTSQYVYSCYVRPGTVNTVSLSLYNNTTATALATINFNVSTGVVVTTTVGSGTITPAGNGWYRCSITHSGTVTATNSVRSYVYPNNTSGNAGDSVIVFGAQLEAGAFATSYIPTSASQVTRAADVASVNTLSPWYNSVAGTLYFEGVTNAPTTTDVRQAVSINDGTLSNTHRIFSYSGKIGASTVISGTNVSDLQPLTYTSGATFKSAYAFAVNDFAMTANGLAPFTDTLGALPPNLSTLSIGGPGIYWGFWVRRITYYPRRLTNAELQTLTTL